MFENEEQVYEALGLEPEQEEPEADEVDVLKEEPAEQTAEDQEEPEAEADGDDETDPEDREEQENPFAAQRSALEEQHHREMEQLRQQHARELDAAAAGLNLVDPYNGNKPITTHAELTAFRQRSAREQLKKGGMTDEQLDAALKDLPEIRAAEDAKAEADAAAEAQRRQAAQEGLKRDIAAIGKLCPEIKSQEDLMKHKSFDKVMQLLKDNTKLGVLDAFRLANFDELSARSAAAASQRTRNQSRGKDHLKGTGSRGTGGSLSREQENMYRKLLPGATRTEILKFHQENMKGE